MALIKGKDGPVEDVWVMVELDEEIPEDKPVIVGLEQFTAERESLLRRTAPLGVRLESHEQVEDIAQDLESFALVALVFPVFKDGRAYSSARLLRERYNYQGEIRAVGNVLRDQLFFMIRCGFNAFDVDPERFTREKWHSAFEEFDVVYQPAADNRTPVMALRSPHTDG
ncbi:MAG: DUF934 domain-containing protein [Parvularculales bacterium]